MIRRIRKFRALAILALPMITTACATIDATTKPETPLSPICAKNLEELSKVTPHDERRLVFHHIQTCIAKNACVSAAKFEDDKWLDGVVNSFVGDYTNKTGKWAQIENKCTTNKGVPPYPKLKCAEDMAVYHITTDLPEALKENDCGSDKDWRTMEGIIKSCVKSEMQFIPFHIYANSKVVSYRNQVRNQCLKPK